MNILQLKQQIQKHGGKTVHAFSATTVTHVVCTNLCASKMKSFSNKRKIYVVHPNWIIDSIKSHAIRPESKYEIVITRDTPSILDYMPKKEEKDFEEESKSTHTGQSQSDTPKGNSNSQSLSLSTDDSQESPKEYKRVTHPLMQNRRSKPATHPRNSLKPPSRIPTEIVSPNLQVSMKQARIGAIMKRMNVPTAQKPF